jgi:hypothetical protein
MRLISIVAFQFAFIVSGFAQTPKHDVYEIYAIEYAASDARMPLKIVAVNAMSADSIAFSYDVWFYYNLQNLLSVPLTFDEDAYIRQLRRMKTLVSNPDLTIPGHVVLVLSKFPSVAKGVVRIR